MPRNFRVKPERMTRHFERKNRLPSDNTTGNGGQRIKMLENQSVKLKKQTFSSTSGVQAVILSSSTITTQIIGKPYRK